MKRLLARVRPVRPPEDAWDTGDPDTALPVFSHQWHSVLLDWLGHEGSVVAHGHIALMEFAWACDSLAERDGRASPTADWMAFTEDVRYGYAVHAFASTPRNWRLHWSDVTADTPGAFPVTIFGTGM
jgi:hypothetical protein